MSTEGNQYPHQSQKIIDQSETHPEYFFQWFQNKFETIKAFVEDIRQLQITSKEDSHITKYTQALVNYLQHPEALQNQKLYRNSLIGLGNFMSIKYNFLKKQYLTQKLFKNIIEYFSILCEQSSSEDFNMLVYPVFYIIVLVIYNADKETTKFLYSKLFVKKFLKPLSHVQFQPGNRIEKYLPVIIAFIAKASYCLDNSQQLKRLILNNIQLAEIQKNHFHFVYSLRMLINKQSLSLGQVRRYDLINYFVKFLSADEVSEQVVTMVLEIMKHVIKRHQILGYKTVNNETLSAIQKAYKVNPDTTLSLLEMIIPCLPYNYKLTMLQSHTKALGKYQYNQSIEMKQLSTIKIISKVIGQISFNDVLVFLEAYSIERLLERTFGSEKRLVAEDEREVVELVEKVINSLGSGSKSLKNSFFSLICRYKDENRRIQLLIQSHQSFLQNPCLLK